MMPPKPVAAPSGQHLHSRLSSLPHLAKAGEIERVNARFARVEQVKQFSHHQPRRRASMRLPQACARSGRRREIGGRACAGTTSIRL
jgi:hypothetical protein